MEFDILTTLTVISLKRILREAKLPLSGTKQILIDRIISNIDKNPYIKTYIDNHRKTPSCLISKSSCKNQSKNQFIKIPKNKSKNKYDIDNEYILNNISNVNKNNVSLMMNNNIKCICLYSTGRVGIHKREFVLFTAALMRNTSVKHLDIFGLTLSTTTIAIVKDILLQKQLVSFDLSHCGNYQLDILEKLNECISNCTLDKLTLTIGLTDKKLVVLTPGLSSNRTIRSLTLRGISIKHIPPVILENDRLTYLDLSGNNIDTRHFKPHMSLSTLLLSRNKLDDCKIKSLCSNLEHSCIEHLDLSGNMFGTSSILYINDLLSKNKHIHTLDLTGNDVDTYGFSQLCNTIVQCRTLVRLYIDTCLFTTCPIEHIETLIRYDVLQELGLSYIFHFEMTSAVIDALKNNRKLRYLGVSSVINKDDVEHFLAAIKMSSVDSLEISNNIIGEHGYIVGDILLNNRLIYLEMNNVSLTEASKQDILDGLVNNNSLVNISARAEWTYGQVRDNDDFEYRCEKYIKRNRKNQKTKRRTLLGMSIKKL